MRFSTASKDLKDKFKLYEEHGVEEYGVVYPGENIIEVFELDNPGTYVAKGKFVREDAVRSKPVERIGNKTARCF